MSFHAALLSVGVLGLAAGGVRTWTVPCLCIIALVASWRIARQNELRLAPLHHVLLAAAAWQTLLIVPLPTAIARLLSPAYADTRAFVWEALPDAPTWAPLAANPAIAALDAARLWATLLLVLVVAERAQKNQSTRGVALAIIGTGLGQMLLSGFVNPNHQAAFWNMGWIVALCAAFVVREQWLRALLSMASAALLVGVAVTGSRAGIVAGALGGLVLGFRLRKDIGRRAGLIAFFLSLGAIIGAGLAGDRVANEMRLRGEEKTRVWRQAASLVPTYPFGAGRGSFALVFQQVRAPDRERGRWDYVENEYLQTLLDYGPVAGALGLLAFAWLCRELARRSRWRIETAGVSAVVVALGAHALFDFNWELAGIFTPVWLLLATLARPKNHAFAMTPFSGRGLYARTIFVAAAACLPLLTAYGVMNDPARLTPDQLVRTRPLDSWAHTVLAQNAMQAGNADEALRWLNRAVYVDRDWQAPHIALARLFCATGRRAQGRAELKLAEDRSGDSGRDPAALPLLLRCIDAPGDEMDVAAALPSIIALLIQDQREESLRAIADLYDGDSPTVLRELAIWARARGDFATWDHLLARWPDSRDKQREQAEREPSRFEALYKDDPAVAARYVDVLLGAGKVDDATRVNDAVTEPRAQQLNRARIAAKRGKSYEALNAYRLWLSRAPKDAQAVQEAEAYAQSIGDKQAASEFADIALKATSR